VSYEDDCIGELEEETNFILDIEAKCDE